MHIIYLFIDAYDVKRKCTIKSEQLYSSFLAHAVHEQIENVGIKYIIMPERRITSKAHEQLYSDNSY